jgi:broad specificity phosphatase PhoE
MKTTFRLIRHAQSQTNAGLATFRDDAVEITEFGRQQAQALAESLITAPSLVVVSPYLRTQQTASPVREHFANVPLKIWPVQEFTYLSAANYAGTTLEQRRPNVAKFWADADPHYRDGADCESFHDFETRVRGVIERMQKLAVENKHKDDVLIFTHGHFTKMVLLLLLKPKLTGKELMQTFGPLTYALAWDNTESLRVQWNEGWSLLC